MRSHAITFLIFVFHFFQQQPFVVLFLVVALGYVAGRPKLKGISLGATGATLIVALLLSLAASGLGGIDYHIPDFIGSVFFNLFMFAIGMKVGPQLLSGLRLGARHFIVLALFTPLLAIAIAIGFAQLFDLPPGVAAGIFGGANTATYGLGAAKDAIESGAARLPAGVSANEAIGSLSTAFALAYCVSTCFFVVMLRVLPQMFGRNAAKDALDFEKKTKGAESAPLPGTADEFLHRPIPAGVRVYRVEAKELEGRSIGELREKYPLAAIERVKHDGKIAEGTDDQILHLGDELALAGRIEQHIGNFKRVGPEVTDVQLTDIGSETVDVVVNNPEVIGRSLEELAKNQGHGLYLNAMIRAGEVIAHDPKTIVEKGDVLRVTGGRMRLSTLGNDMGPVVGASVSTDIVTLAVGIALGAFLGALSIRVGGVKLSIGSAVGLLGTGVVLSILRTRNPTIGGPFPEPVRQLFEDLGLNVFVAVLGLNSGKSVIAAVRAGIVVPIIVGSLLIGLIPPFLAWLIGQYRFKMNTAILMGAVAGARCNTCGMRACTEVTRSSVPAISYPLTFAISSVAVTLASYFFGIYL